MFENIKTYLWYRRRFGSVRRILSTNKFENEDIGPINDIGQTSKFVISIPKCGTTALQKGFERIGHNVIHAHNDPTTYDAFDNGNLLRAGDIGLATLVRFRRHLDRKPVHIFFGYREPISWYLSLAGHFGLLMNADLRAKIVENLRSAYPWNNYQFEETQRIIEAATGIGLFEEPFDRVQGYSVRCRRNLTVVVYRFDKMTSLEGYIRAEIDRAFQLDFHRVNSSDDYRSFVEGFRLPMATIQELYSGRAFSYFHNAEDTARLMARYAET